MYLYALILLGSAYSLGASPLDTKYHDDQGYYWRDYVGITPIDAFPAGFDNNGSISYIGQVLHKSLLIPGELVAPEKRIYYEWGSEQFVATENVKILCTRNPEQFQWVITSAKELKTLTDKHFVSGGYEPNNRIYIGRTSASKKLGKIRYRNFDDFATLHLTIDGKGVPKDVFEILATVREP